MRLIIRIPLLALLLFAPMAASLHAASNDQVSVRAILVSASKEPGKSDGRLSAYESTLRRILRFESFQQLGSGRGRAAVPGEGSVSVGQGQSLQFVTESSQDDRLRVKLTWKGGGRTFMRTGLVLRPGVPAVLGGPSQKNGNVYALIVIAE